MIIIYYSVTQNSAKMHKNTSVSHTQKSKTFSGRRQISLQYTPLLKCLLILAATSHQLYFVNNVPDHKHFPDSQRCWGLKK